MYNIVIDLYIGRNDLYVVIDLYSGFRTMRVI